MSIERRRIQICGIVQGVGFRPFVYGQALAHQLTGFVLNGAEGVLLEVQGESEVLNRFTDVLQHQAPPLSRIDEWHMQVIATQSSETDFTIIASHKQTSATVCVSPDQGVCPACLDDIHNPDDRHYRYPFTNCTHCGPRYTLIKQLPYDRPYTAMAEFMMCDRCAQAYSDPLDRRYHAQPVSCPQCGPQIRSTDGQGRSIANTEEALQLAISGLMCGELWAVKGIGGYHLMCDAGNDLAVRRLRQLKHRQRKPLAVMMRDRVQAERYVMGSEEEWALALSQPRPITLLLKRHTLDQANSPLSPALAPGVAYQGIFFPYTPLHHLLLEGCNTPLVATSANLSGRPILTDFTALVMEFGGMIDGILDHNRPIIHACDDSLVQIAGGHRQMLRLGRGYAPWSPHLAQTLPCPILSVGAQQKSSLGLAFQRQRIYSPYIGDLHSVDMQQHFESMLQVYQDLYDFTPQVIVADQHPRYISTQWAQEFAQTQAIPLLQVQHHHAHLLAVMSERGYTDTVLGFAFDGTGFGDDGHIWGGEVLLADVKQAQRVAYLRPFRLIGGEQAIREPARLLLGLLLEYYSVDQIKALNIRAFEHWPENKLDNLCRIWAQRQNAPLTTSMGRLFDAVACLLNIAPEYDYEGESGLLLDAAARHALSMQVLPSAVNDSISGKYFMVTEGGVIDPAPLVEALLQQVASSEQAQIQALIFIRAVAELISTLSQRWPQYPLVLAGGVFQNRLLMDEIAAVLHSQQRDFWVSETLPLNDGGIAAGQLWFAIHHCLHASEIDALPHFQE